MVVFHVLCWGEIERETEKGNIAADRGYDGVGGGGEYKGRIWRFVLCGVVVIMICCLRDYTFVCIGIIYIYTHESHESC